MRIQKIFFESPSKNVSPLKSRQKNVRIVKIQKERKRDMEEKKKQEFQVSENFEIEESNAMKVLRGKGEENENPHESKLPQKKVDGWKTFGITTSGTQALSSAELLLQQFSSFSSSQTCLTTLRSCTQVLRQ